MSLRLLNLSRAVELSPIALSRLQSLGFELVANPGDSAADRKTLLSLISDIDACIVGTHQVDEDFLSRAPRLRLVVKAGAGVDNLDMGAAERRGVTLASLPGGNTDAVAE